jgi:hypothetical protein
VSRTLAKTGMLASDIAELGFHDVRVPAANLLGREGVRFHEVMRVFQRERLVAGLHAVSMFGRAPGSPRGPLRRPLPIARPRASSLGTAMTGRPGAPQGGGVGWRKALCAAYVLPGPDCRERSAATAAVCGRPTPQGCRRSRGLSPRRTVWPRRISSVR